MGFIAQDIKEAIPQQWQNLVGSFEKANSPPDLAEPSLEQYLTLDYARLTAVLWSVCQNMDRRIKALEARNGKHPRQRRAQESL